MTRDCIVIDVPFVQVFPPDPVSALPQVPGDYSTPILAEHFHWPKPTTENPIDIIAEANQPRLSVLKIVMKLARAIAHFRHVIVNSKAQPEFVQIGAQLS